jgi:hypothetical protein
MKKFWMLSIGIIFIAFGLYSFSGISFLNVPRIDAEKKVCISTNYGDIKIKLYNETPQHRDNFLKLAQAAYFDGLLFHRVIKGFMIQGGDPDSKNADSTAILGNGGPKYTIPAEIFYDTITSKTPFTKKGRWLLQEIIIPPRHLPVHSIILFREKLIPILFLLN